MVNIEDIRATISKLEDRPTTMQNCKDLAYLYIVLDHQVGAPQDAVVTEYNDILPSYTKYCGAKRNFQLNTGTDTAVVQALDILCREIKEFISTLYSNTDTPEERAKIKEYLTAAIQGLQ